MHMRTRVTLDTVRQKQREDRLRHIQRINEQEETNTSSYWNVASVGVTTGRAAGIKEFIDSIAAVFHVKSPTEESVLSFMQFSYWQSFFLQWVSPAALALGWKNTWDATRRFQKAENRNWMRYLDVGVSFATSIVSTAMFFVGGVKLGLTLALGAFAVNAAYGLFNTGKNLINALFAKNSSERKQYLINAGKQFISIFTNSFAFVANFLLGVQLPVPGAAVGEIYKTASTYTTALTISAITGIAADSAQTTLKTIKGLWNKATRAQTLQQMKKDFFASPIKSTLLFPLRIATIPVQLILYGAYKGLKSLVNWIKPIPIPTEKKIEEERDEKFQETVRAIQTRLSQHEEKCALYKAKGKKIPDELKAKKQLLENLLHTKLGVTTNRVRSSSFCPDERLNDNTVIRLTDIFVAEAKKISPHGLFRSSRTESETSKLVRKVNELEHYYAPRTPH